MTKKTGRRFLTRSLKVLTRAWVVVEVVRIHTVWFPGPARLRVERIASSGLAARRDRSSSCKRNTDFYHLNKRTTLKNAMQ